MIIRDAPTGLQSPADRRSQTRARVILRGAMVEIALLIEICDRADRDPDLLRPAPLLCAAYARLVARMLVDYI